jgi:hypothetical protein
MKKLIMTVMALLVLGAPGGARAETRQLNEEQKMLMTAYANLKMAEVFDKRCNQGKVTGKVKDRGHPANFARNRTLLETEISNAFGKDGMLSPPQVEAYLGQVGNAAQADMTKEIDDKGCKTDKSEHAERVLDIFTRTQADYLIKTLRKYIAGQL